MYLFVQNLFLPLDVKRTTLEASRHCRPHVRIVLSKT